jgi:hypothetical protein
MLMNKIILLGLIISCLIHASHAMETPQEYYERFKVAYIQSSKELIDKLWNELRQLNMQERDIHLDALKKHAKKSNSLGIYTIFAKVCHYCLQPSAKVEYNTYCRCKSKMCESCFRTITYCGRCDAHF